jgi:hypothetical protein
MLPFSLCNKKRLGIRPRLKGSMPGVASFIAVACFLPSRDKDLSAPRYTYIAHYFSMFSHSVTACHNSDVRSCVTPSISRLLHCLSLFIPGIIICYSDSCPVVPHKASSWPHYTDVALGLKRLCTLSTFIVIS